MGLINPAMVVFFKDYVFTLRTFPQVWRLVTSFILTGPKFGLLMDPYFLFTYGSSLETASAAFSQPGDFFVYLVFVAAVILVSLHLLHKLSFVYAFRTPRNICPYSNYSNCHGSWKRGRSPLHCAAIIIRNLSRLSVECGHGGMPH